MSSETKNVVDIQMVAIRRCFRVIWMMAMLYEGWTLLIYAEYECVKREQTN